MWCAYFEGVDCVANSPVWLGGSIIVVVYLITLAANFYDKKQTFWHL